jgi:hypothetical protein
LLNLNCCHKMRCRNKTRTPFSLLCPVAFAAACASSSPSIATERWIRDLQHRSRFLFQVLVLVCSCTQASHVLCAHLAPALALSRPRSAIPRRRSDAQRLPALRSLVHAKAQRPGCRLRIRARPGPGLKPSRPWPCISVSGWYVFGAGGGRWRLMVASERTGARRRQCGESMAGRDWSRPRAWRVQERCLRPSGFEPR